MQYMLLIYNCEPQESDPERTATYVGLAGEDRVAHSAQLQPTSTATTVRGTLTTDGPFMETKEILGGYYLIEADDLDEALEFARRLPAAQDGGAVEVRPVVMRP